MKIVVLAGGMSTERNVSLVTGSGVCKALRRKGHKAVIVDMFLGLESYDGNLEEIFDAPDGLCKDYNVSATAPDLQAVRASRQDKSTSVLGKDVLKVCTLADVVFLALHGECGEDGRIQATLDLLGVPYTGSDYVSSAMAMNKAITKRYMDAEGIKNAPWKDVHYTIDDIDKLTQELDVPCAVKIVNGGSSVGVELPDTKEDLARALQNISRYGNHVVVEKKISGREMTVAVLGDRYLPAVEICPNGDYFNYETKYQANGATELCPAPIDDELWHKMGEAALKLHNALGLSVYSRTDFLLDENNEVWCLEVNTLPGMTPTSLVPQEAAAVGIDYDTLCEKIVELSLEARKKERGC